MEWKLVDIREEKSIAFEAVLELSDSLQARNQDILALTQVAVTGTVSYEDGFYDLFFEAEYELTLPSTRSLAPVRLPESLRVHEVYVADDGSDAALDDFILTLSGETLSLDEAVADNILLEIPSQVLTDDEKKEKAELPSGQGWQLLSEEEFARQQEAKKKEASPFKDLQGLFE